MSISLLLSKSIYIVAMLVLLLTGSAFGANNNPFYDNPKLRDYSQRAIPAVESQAPAVLTVVEVDEKEIEDVYQYLVTQIDKPFKFWQVVLLDYPRLRLLRNNIYAHHGRPFDSSDLDTYFRSFNWYKPDNNFTEARLSRIDKENISSLTRMEYIKVNHHKELGEVIKFSKIGPAGSESRDEQAVNVPWIDGTIIRSFTGCCGDTSGNTNIKNRDGQQFRSFFSSAMEYIVPLWGNNLIAWIVGEKNDSESDDSPKRYDRIAILNYSGKAIIDIHLPRKSLITGEYLDQIGLRQLVLLSPNVLYSLSSNHNYRGQDNIQILLFIKNDLQFKPRNL